MCIHVWSDAYTFMLLWRAKVSVRFLPLSRDTFFCNRFSLNLNLSGSDRLTRQKVPLIPVSPSSSTNTVMCAYAWFLHVCEGTKLKSSCIHRGRFTH